MLNYFQTNPDEFRRVVRYLRTAPRQEAGHFLNYRSFNGHYGRSLARALNIEREGKFLNELHDEIWSYLQKKNPREPVIHPEDKPRVIVPDGICDGCAGIGDTAKFLRWKKVDKGEPVTISIDLRHAPAALLWLTPEIILSEWYEPWAVDTSIRFRYLETKKGDIHIRFAPIDGPGKTRGFAWMPNQSIDDMAAGGDLSGDMVIDSLDRWTTKTEVHETGEHEGGHTIGLPHTDSPIDVMYAYAQGRRRKQSRNDLIAKTTRYPLKAAA